MKKIICFLFILINLNGFSQTVSQFINASKSAYGKNKLNILTQANIKYPKEKDILYDIVDIYYKKEDYINTTKYVNMLLKLSNDFEKNIILNKYKNLNLSKKVIEQKTKAIAQSAYDNIMNNLYFSDLKLLQLIKIFQSKYNNYDFYKIKYLENEIKYHMTTDLSVKYNLYTSGGNIKYNIYKDWKNNHECGICDGYGKVYDNDKSYTYPYSCPDCGGTGKCSRCAGKGLIYYEGWLECYVCNANGRCHHCNGSGKLYAQKKYYKTCSRCNGKGYY